MTKISVIIPVYNTEKYLRECLESTINQTFKDIEIICIDDGSTDKSLSILKEFEQKDNRIKVITQKNLGQSVARNVGIKQALGEYIFFMDADDSLRLNILEKLYNKILATKSDVVLSQLEAFADDDSLETKQRVERTNNWISKQKIYDNYKIDLTTFADAIVNIACVSVARLYSKDFLLKNKIYFIDKHVKHEDNGFWLKFCINFPIIGSIPDVGYFYRIRNTSTVAYESCPDVERIRYKNMKIILKDVCNYLKQNFDKQMFKKILSQIQDSLEYKPFWDYKLGFLYKYKWTYNEKYIYFLKLRLFKATQTQNLKQWNILGIKFCVKNQKLIRIVYSWENNQKNKEFSFGEYKFTTKPIKKCDLLLSLNASKNALNIKSKQAWCLSFEPPTEYLEFQKFYPIYDRVYTASKVDGCDSVINYTVGQNWWLGKTYDELVNLEIPEKNNDIVWVTSKICFFEGHKKRLKFLDFVQTNTNIKVYGKGIQPIDTKWQVYEHAKYTMGIENTYAEDYWTEKIADSFLAYSMPIYYGCPNIEKYFPPEAMIKIDIEKPEEAMQIIQNAIDNNLWEKNFDYILQARKIVLEQLWYPKFVINELEKINLNNMDYKTYKIPKCDKHTGFVKKTTFIQNIFSVANQYEHEKKIKVITILGIKIKIKK